MKIFTLLAVLLCTRATNGNTMDIQYIGDSLANSADSVSIPPTAFVLGRKSSDGSALHLRTVSRVNSLARCNVLEFKNIPANISSPLMGSNLFVEGPEYNKHRSWSNGKEFLSFVDNGDQGTWILGVEPGIDSGYVFIRPTFRTLVPVGLETSSVNWKWNLKGKWTPMLDLRMECADQDQDSSHYYMIEYFDSAAGSMQETVMVPSSGAYQYQDTATSSWVSVEVEEVVCLPGYPVAIQDKTLQSTRYARLVNNEHSSVGWSTTFRYVDDLAVTARTSDSSRDEVIIAINGDGSISNYHVRPLSSAEVSEYEMSLVNQLRGVKRGDYVWMWHTPAGLRDKTTGETNWKLPSQKTNEVLLVCVSASHNTWRFRFHHDDRRLAMGQTVLSSDVDLYSITITSNSSQSLSLHNFVVALDEAKSPSLTLFSLSGFLALGPDPVEMLKKYIVEKEKILASDVSSCYLYHAAVSVPQQFVYAIEILCVLMGAKPATMIQYTSNNDEQWKFPLVRELSTAVVLARQQLGPSVGFDYQVTVYENYETLVIYRTNRDYVASNLLPRGTVQALHPMPFPRDDHQQEDYREQIYNAAWNGLLLGYPQRFVKSYCEDFHNDLSKDVKASVFNKAKTDIGRYLRSIDKSVEIISLGLDPVVDEEVWQFLKSHMY